MTTESRALYTEYVVPKLEYNCYVSVARALGVLTAEYPQLSRVGIQATLQEIISFNNALLSYRETRSISTDPETTYEKRHQAHRASLFNL